MMNEFGLQILVVTIAISAMLILWWRILSATFRKSKRRPRTGLNLLDSRIQLIKEQRANSAVDSFLVEFRGRDQALGNTSYAKIRISITDITRGTSKGQPVHSQIKKWQQPDSAVFVYTLNPPQAELLERSAPQMPPEAGWSLKFFF